MPASYNFYEILGLSQGAEAAEIKAAYRQLAMRYHPDKNPSQDAHAQFVAINAAYEVLSDPFKRRLYDLRRQKVVFRAVRPQASAHTAPIDHEEMRRRYWSSPAGQRKRRELEQVSNFFYQMNRAWRIISLPIVVFMFLLLIDSFFPKEFSALRVTYVKSKVEGIGGDTKNYYQYQLGKHLVWVRLNVQTCLHDGDLVQASIGRIFGIISSIELPRNCTYKTGSFKGEETTSTIDPSQSIFSGTGILIYIILFLNGVLWWEPLSSSYGSGASFISFLMTIIVCILFMRLLP